MSRLLWRLLPSVRRPERTRFLFFMSLSGLITVAQTLGLVGCESLLLAYLGPTYLPLTFVAASLLTVLGSVIYAMGVQRARNDIYFIKILLVFANLVSLGSVAIQLQYTWVLPFLYSLYYVSQSVLTNHYWTFTGDFFDTLTAKRLFPLFVVGSSLGGLLGGLAVTVLGPVAPPQILLVAWAIFLVMTALVLRGFRRHLRRWGPLELEEADETSLSGMLNSMRYLRQSSLGRWLVVSALGMVLALFVAQYLYSEIFSRAYPDPDRLAMFLGALLAVTNLLEVFIEVLVTPWLIRHLGVASANLVHPVLTVGAFLLLASNYTLAAAVVARINRETVENALAGPVRNLVYNALPARFRGRMRAFLEGIVVYSGMVTAGLALLVLQGRVDALIFCGAGCLTALLYLAANVKVRSEYLRTLVSELRAGRLDLLEMGAEIGSFEVQRLSELWDSLVSEERERPSLASLRFVQTLAGRGIHEPLLKGARQASPGLRKACLEALGQAYKESMLGLFLESLSDPNPEIRLVALKALPMRLSPEARVTLLGLLEDEDPRVRAQAALRLGPEGRDALTAMVTSDHTATAVAGLEALPRELVPEALIRGRDADLTVRAAALECLARHGGSDNIEADLKLAQANLKNVNVQVRIAAVKLLACQAAEGEPLILAASALGDPSHEVRHTASRLLSAWGDPSVSAAEPYLQSESLGTVKAAVEALAGVGSARARELLGSQLRERVSQAWVHLLGLHLLEHLTPDSANGSAHHLEFLAVSLHNAAERNRRLAFDILEQLEDAKVMRSVAKVLRFPKSRGRADALEVLSNLGDREASHLLVLMLEDGSLEDKIPALPPQVLRFNALDQVLDWAAESNDRWIHLSAAGAVAASGEGHPREELMERLLVLRKVPLFAQMTLEQLEAINVLLVEEQYLAGENIFQEGDVGDELYILVEGEVRIVKAQGTPQELELARMQGVSYFGEMSILDDDPRSAGVVATKESRMLVLKGEQLKELVLQMPEIAFEVFKVLTSRIRQADDRLNQMAKGLASKSEAS